MARVGRARVQHLLVGAAPWLYVILEGGEAALTVLPCWTEDLVVQLRSAFYFDEADLLWPPARRRCSSLRDGPSCPLRAATGLVDAGFSFSRGSSGHHVIDGVLPQRLREERPGAFDWDDQRWSVFGGAVARQAAKSKLGGGHQRSSRSRSRCFRVDFGGLGPALRRLPPHFSAGLPREVKATWEGDWNVVLESWQWPERDSADAPSGGARAVRSAGLVLRGASGRLRFSSPVAVSQLWADATGVRNAACIRGMVKGRQAWRSELPFRVPQPTAAAHGRELVNVGHGVFAVDEVAFSNLPAEGLHVALVEVSATPLRLLKPESPQGMSGDSVEERMRKAVLLLKLQGTSLIPMEVQASPDASLWDANEVLRFNMRIRPQNATSLGAHLHWPLTPGGCCQVSDADHRCASYEYPGGACARLPYKSIGCKRGHWNHRAEYDGRDRCIEHGGSAVAGAPQGKRPPPPPPEPSPPPAPPAARRREGSPLSEPASPRAPLQPAPQPPPPPAPPPPRQEVASSAAAVASGAAAAARGAAAPASGAAVAASRIGVDDTVRGAAAAAGGAAADAAAALAAESGPAAGGKASASAAVVIDASAGASRTAVVAGAAVDAGGGGAAAGGGTAAAGSAAAGSSAAAASGAAAEARRGTAAESGAAATAAGVPAPQPQQQPRPPPKESVGAVLRRALAHPVPAPVGLALPGGCCQVSESDNTCAKYEYPDGLCVKLQPLLGGRRHIGCQRGWWNARADYEPSTGRCEQRPEDKGGRSEVDSP